MHKGVKRHHAHKTEQALGELPLRGGVEPVKLLGHHVLTHNRFKDF